MSRDAQMKAELKLLQGSLAVWLILFVLAFFNGALREIFIKHYIQEPWSHQVSALTAILLFTSGVWLAWPLTHIHTLKVALFIGSLWFVLTVSAETFLIGRWLGNRTWREIFYDYDISSGHLWPIVLIWIAFMPAVINRLKSRT